MKKLVFHGKSGDKPTPAKIAYAEGTDYRLGLSWPNPPPAIG